MDNYNPKIIEPKWQKKWVENPDLYAAKDRSDKPKKYVLDMFPYPSGDGLHVGHVESYTATDILARYFRMKGFNVLHPQGWDAFGLPAENYAIKTGTHPDITTKKNIETFKRQIKSLGMSYDWSREVDTSSPEYYKWTQWFFLLLYKNGLAYKKKAKVNWCESCQTVLANEQAEGGICDRCKNKVVQKNLEQWFFKITDLIEQNRKTAGLLDGLEKVDWPESIKAAQKNWIGRSEGAQFKMRIDGTEEYIEVYTTRIDTVFGMTYAVIAPEHETVQKLKDKIENWDEVEKYLIAAQNKTELERMETKEKTGVEMKGVKLVNPFNQEKIPLFVGDYVLAHYGTGAVMAVPAHDERDFEFAKKYNLPIKQSIAQVFVEEGENKMQDDKPNTERSTVDVIVKHWEKDEYFCLDWKYKNWKSFIIGGIEGGETPEEAAIREVIEESGYKNARAVCRIGGEIHSYFYAAHKGVNRSPVSRKCILVELTDGEYEEPKEEHTRNHAGVWIKREDVSKFLSFPELKIYWSTFLNGERAFVEDGTVINSVEFSKLKSQEAREKMTAWLEKEGIGERKINYKIRDWLVSRQRYWGAPIPIVYCEKCGEVAVPEKDLPVLLPTDVDFKPTGESPLKYSKTFQDVKCPQCGGAARRESDTMDTFVCSSWYYFRYADAKNGKEFADTEKIKYWLPVDVYVGGAEHAVLHLLYARFFTKVLHNLGMIGFDEPFLKLRNQGLILAEDGRKMSKSLGNVVNPDQVVAQFGADALRMFEMFMGPLEDAKPWNTRGIVGIKRFLEKVYRLEERIKKQEESISNNKIENLLHKTIKKVTDDIEGFRFNTAISAMMILVNEMEKQEKLRVTDYQLLVTILSPFAPHLAEELWEKLGHTESIFLQSWPQYDQNLIKDEIIKLVVQVNGKVRDTIEASANLAEDEAKELAMQSEKAKNFIEGKEIKKIIFVKGKLINIVVG
jgi:leucyl-tRNA synthetase